MVSILTYRRHHSLALEAPSHSVVDTLGFPPACVNAFVGVALVSIETLSVYSIVTSASTLCIIFGGPLYDIAMERVVFLIAGHGREELTLLHDRNVLFCGGHLESNMDQSIIVQRV